MKTFRDYLKEEVMPTALSDGSIDINKDSVRAEINGILAATVNKPWVTPYVALRRVSKALAYFHIVLNQKPYLEGTSGVEAWEIHQFGDKMGMTDQGEFVKSVPADYHLFFHYDLIGSMFMIRAKIVDQAELNKELDMAEATLKEDASDQLHKSIVNAPKEPIHANGKEGSPSAKKAMDVSDRKGNKKLSDGSLDKKWPAVNEGRMPASVIAHKQKLANMSDKEFAEKHGHKSEKDLRDMAARHGYGWNKETKTGSDHYVKRLSAMQKEETLDEVSKGLLGRYIKKAHVSGLGAAAEGEKAYSRKDKQTLRAANKTGEKREQGIERAVDKMTGRARVHAKEETLDEVSKGAAIRAYGASQDYDNEHPKGEKIKAHIVKKFGAKTGEHAERHADSSNFGRSELGKRSTGTDRLAQATPSSKMRMTKSGKVHKQDVASKKSEIKFRKSMSKFDAKRGHLPEEQIDELKKTTLRSYRKQAQHDLGDIKSFKKHPENYPAATSDDIKSAGRREKTREAGLRMVAKKLKK